MHHDSILRTPSLRSIVSHLSTFQYFLPIILQLNIILSKIAIIRYNNIGL